LTENPSSTNQSFEKLQPKNQGRHLRRINQQHRGVYIVDENLKQVEIYSAGRFVGLSGMARGSMPGERVIRAWRGTPCPADGLSGHGAELNVRQTDYPGMTRGSMPGKRITRAWRGTPCPSNGLSGHGSGFHARQTGYPGMAQSSMSDKRVIRAWRGTQCPADGLSGHGATIFTVIFENRCHCHKPG